MEDRPIWERMLEVVAKKIRNRKKKMEKVQALQVKVKTDRSFKPNEEQQEKLRSIEQHELFLKEFEEMHQMFKTDIKKHNKKNHVPQGTKTKTVVSVDVKKETSQEVLQLVSKACLVGSLENEQYDQKFLDDSTSSALQAVTYTVDALRQKDSTIRGDRFAESFVKTFDSLYNHSEEIIPGTSSSYQSVAEQLEAIPSQDLEGPFNVKEEESEEEEVKHVEPVKEVHVPVAVAEEPK